MSVHLIQTRNNIHIQFLSSGDQCWKPVTRAYSTCAYQQKLFKENAVIYSTSSPQKGFVFKADRQGALVLMSGNSQYTVIEIPPYRKIGLRPAISNIDNRTMRNTRGNMT